MTEAAGVAAAAAQRGTCKPVTPKVLIVLCCFLATFSAYVERVGFSIAFTAMSKQAQLGEHVKGNVLSAFYWGYGVSQVRAAVGWWQQHPQTQRQLAVLMLRHAHLSFQWQQPHLTLPQPLAQLTVLFLAPADPRRLGSAALRRPHHPDRVIPGMVHRQLADPWQCGARGAHCGSARSCGRGAGRRDTLRAHSALAGKLAAAAAAAVAGAGGGSSCSFEANAQRCWMRVHRLHANSCSSNARPKARKQPAALWGCSIHKL
jgi:hypothetical protein